MEKHPGYAVTAETEQQFRAEEARIKAKAKSPDMTSDSLRLAAQTARELMCCYESMAAQVQKIEEAIAAQKAGKHWGR